MGHSKTWRGGMVDPDLGPMPEQYRGQSGCLFRPGVFEEAVGEELYLLMLEESGFVQRVASADPFNLSCTTGVATTSAGTLAFLLWSVYDGPDRVVTYEHFLNPFNAETMDLLRAVGRQPRLEVMVVDSMSFEVRNYLGFINNFGIREFTDALPGVLRGRSCPSFAQAQAAFMNEFDTSPMVPELWIG